MTVPASAALTDVPSGTARLMPSFRWPAVPVPKPAMMRPRTGQRKVVPLADGPSLSSIAALGGVSEAWVAGISALPAATAFTAASTAGGGEILGSGALEASWIGAGAGFGATTATTGGGAAGA